jgi:Ala-tRNA(Pro) deacylase
MSTEKRLLEFLNSSGVEFKYVEHNQIEGNRCEDSSKARGIDLKYGAKTLLMKANDSFHIFTLSAAKKANSKKMRKVLGAHKLRFATADELMEHCGVIKGALPPFGRPLFDFDHYIDESIYKLDIVAFNAAVLEKSCIMSSANYLSLVDAQRVSISD